MNKHQLTQAINEVQSDLQQVTSKFNQLSQALSNYSEGNGSAFQQPANWQYQTRSQDQSEQIARRAASLVVEALEKRQQT